MIKVALTGGIGAGKSIVAKIFHTIGIPVYSADLAAKRLMESKQELIEAIKEEFTEQAYVDGKLNRKYIADIIFKNKQKLETLNKIVHPFTIQDGKEWMEKQNSPYAIKEAALIFETGIQGEFDHIIGVFAPEHLRVARTIKRDGATREAIIERIGNQLDENIKMRLCDDIIVNDEQQLLLPQVLNIHKKLLQLYK